MKIENQIITKKQAKMLAALGVQLHSYFLWSPTLDKPLESWTIDGTEDEFYPALNVAEMGLILSGTFAETTIWDPLMYSFTINGKDQSETFETEAICRGEQILYLIKQGDLSVDRINMILSAV